MCTQCSAKWEEQSWHTQQGTIGAEDWIRKAYTPDKTVSVCTAGQACLDVADPGYAQAVEALGKSIKGSSMSTERLAEAANTSFRVDKRTGQAVAIKVIDVENAEDEVEDIIQEISILSELHSPYVTQYHGSFLKGSDLWIIMEFCSGGSCADLLKPGLIPEEYITIIVRELLLGLEYLHGDKKLHRDIKGMVPLGKKSSDRRR